MNLVHSLLLITITAFLAGCDRQQAVPHSIGNADSFAIGSTGDSHASNSPKPGMEPCPASLGLRLDGKVLSMADDSFVLLGGERFGNAGLHTIYCANPNFIERLKSEPNFCYSDYPLPLLMYTFEDLVPGDYVDLRYTQMGDIKLLEIVRIVRRPGGQIPPARIEGFGKDRPYHRVMQECQDREESGLTLPRVNQLIKPLVQD